MPESPNSSANSTEAAFDFNDFDALVAEVAKQAEASKDATEDQVAESEVAESKVAESKVAESEATEPKVPATVPEPEVAFENEPIAIEVPAEELADKPMVHATAAEVELAAPQGEVIDAATLEARKGKPSLVSRAKSIVRKNGQLIGACGLSALFGMSVIWLFPSGKPEEEVVAKPEPVYYASTSHRIEPIQPIVPFKDLHPDVVELGKRLFHDKKLSGNGKVSCASCHNLDKGGEDGLPIAQSFSSTPLRRNTPSIYNAALNFVQFWDGRAETLEEQIDEHLDSGVLDSDWERVVKVVTLDPFYNRSFQVHMGSEPDKDLIRNAFVAYERSLLTVDSKFDQWLQGKTTTLASDEIGGYLLFKKHNCISCHHGEAVGGSMFQPLTRLADHFKSVGTKIKADTAVRVPSLRNVELTAPYFHDGSVETLENAIELMLENHAGVEPNATEVARIAAFLRTLTGHLPNE